MRPFVLFGPDHLAVVGALVTLAAALVVSRSRLRTMDDRGIRWVLAAVLCGNEVSAFVVALAHGVVVVPLQLCDLALAAAVWALVTLQRSVAQIAYCWALAGSVQAILTPDLVWGFPSYWWIQFFLSHGGVVLSVLYLALTGRVALTPAAVWKIWGLTNVYAAAAGAFNWTYGTNLGYLAQKPAQPSLLDYMGPWPQYLMTMEALALALLFLCYLPFGLAHRNRRWATPVSADSPPPS